MTTPLIKHISPAQVRKLNATGWWDKFLTAGTPAWKCPPCDHPVVPRDRSEPGPTQPITWGRYDLPVTATTSKLTQPAYGVVIQTGYPMEMVNPARGSQVVNFDSPYFGNVRTEMIPIPPGEGQIESILNGSKGTAWSEGMPTYGGAYDHHWIGVEPDGSIWELIGLRYVFGAWWATEGGKWKDGKLISGQPATASTLSLSSLILTPQVLADPSVVGIIFPNYADRDGTDKTAPIRCGDWMKLKNPPDPLKVTGDQFKLLSLLHTKGAKIHDRGPDNAKEARIVLQAGEPWVGSNLDSLKLRTTDFEVVVRS